MISLVIKEAVFRYDLSLQDLLFASVIFCQLNLFLILDKVYPLRLCYVCLSTKVNTLHFKPF